MRIDIPKILRAIRLADYAAEFGEAIVWVWVNPPRARLLEYENIRARAQAAASDAESFRAASAEFATWYAEMWSQHADAEMHIDAAGVLQIAEQDTDPHLYVWLLEETWRLVNEHRAGEKKK
jgi:hypothetical protein